MREAAKGAMRDAIHIERLELWAHLGVPDEERAEAQRIEVNITLEPSMGFEELGDEIERAVDYFQVCEAVKALVRERPRRLIETLAEEIAGLLLERFRVGAVSVELRKFILPDTAHVCVRVRRESRLQP
jgi:7,8-dihydroneopterin aldolase/epimerase/oxygenase